MAEYKLKYTASEIDRKLEKVDNMSWNDLTDRPFDEVKEFVLITSIKDFDTNSISATCTTPTKVVGNVIEMDNFTVQVGATYKVVINDEEYFLEGKYHPNMDAYYIGNISFYDANKENTGENFTILTASIGYASFFIVDEGFYNVDVYMFSEQIHMLDVKYIPAEIQSDWNQNDETSIYFVKNRPFYEVGNETQVIYDASDEYIESNRIGQTGEMYECWLSGALLVNNLEPGDIYDVIFDGVLYPNVVVSDGYFRKLGCKDFEELTSDNAPYPFIFWISDGGSNREAFVTTPGTHSFVVKRITAPGYIVKLDEKYLPDTIATKEYVDEAVQNVGGGVSSWNDLIDKPFYSEVETVEIWSVTDCEFKLDEEQQICYFEIEELLPVGIESGKTYLVNWDGVEYECKAITLAEDVDVRECAIGNMSDSGVWVDTKEPFIIFSSYLKNIDAYALYVSTNDITKTTHSITLSVVDEVVHRLDAKFLPEPLILYA